MSIVAHAHPFVVGVDAHARNHVYTILTSATGAVVDTKDFLPLLLVATIWYLLVTSLLMVGQYYVEQHYAKGRTKVGGGLDEELPAILLRGNSLAATRGERK